MGVTAQSSPTMNGLLVLSLLPLPPRRLFCPTGVLLAILTATLATLTPWPSPSSTRWRCPCPSCSTPPSTPAARTPSVTPCPASRRERRAGRGPLTRKRPRLPPLLPPSFPTILDSDTTVLATLVSATLVSTTPTPSPPLPLLRLRCPSPSTSTSLRSRPLSFPPPARTLSALPFPAPKSVVKV